MKHAVLAYLIRRPIEGGFFNEPERKTKMMTGWKTLMFNGGVVVLTALLQWMAGIDWVAIVGPEWAVTAVALVNFVLRFMTSTPWGQAK